LSRDEENVSKGFSLERRIKWSRDIDAEEGRRGAVGISGMGDEENGEGTMDKEEDERRSAWHGGQREES
jgi:hypothetical protein